MPWYHATELPKEFEGREAYRWLGNGGTVDQTIVPMDYSREPHHCCNVHFFPIIRPEPPSDWTDWRVKAEEK